MDNTTDDVKGAELLPCPFCGSHPSLMGRNSFITGDSAAIRCDNCQVAGPWRRSVNDAVAAWNTRAQLVSLKASPAGEGILIPQPQCPIHGDQWCTCRHESDPTPEQVLKGAAKLVASINQETEFWHKNDCAVHSPTLRPCSCGLETKMRSEIDRLRLALSRESVSVLGDDGHPIESPESIHDFNGGSGEGGYMTENLSPDLLAEALRQSLERELELEKKLKDAEGLLARWISVMPALALTANPELLVELTSDTAGFAASSRSLDAVFSPTPRDPAQGDERQGM
jgi:Lar family restriction alleviation protein